MPKIPATSSIDDDTVDVKPYSHPASSPKKSPSSSPKKTGKQNAKKWSKQDKIDILLKVLQTATPDWQAMADEFGEGRTKSQVHDQWRQHILPTAKAEGRVMKTE